MELCDQAARKEINVIVACLLSVESHDPERECRLTVNPETGALTIFLRHDALTASLPTDCLQAAPDVQGVLHFEWPYTELQEGVLPQDWHFDGAGRVAIFGYHLTPDATPRSIHDLERE